MKPVLYISTFLIIGIFASCSNDVSMGDKESETKKTQTPLPGDVDGDGVLDEDDNCPTLANADQADGDGDGVGNVCEDLECASNFCQDSAFLSDRHCDGDVSVGCLAQSDGCLIETSRVSCSEGCGSEGDFMGVCKPKPRDLTDPLIIEATGTMSHGNTVTITGEDFGSHDLNIEWTGNKIEETTLGTNPDTWENWTHYQYTPSGQYNKVSNERPWSGEKSLDLEVDQVGHCNGGVCACRLSYDIPQGTEWKKIFISYWFRLEGIATEDEVSSKHLWITNNNEDGLVAPFGTVRNAFQYTGSVQVSTSQVYNWEGQINALAGCSPSTNPGGSVPTQAPYVDPTSGIGYQKHPASLYWSQYATRGAGENLSEYGFNDREWVRLEYYVDRGTPDIFDGESYMATFRPEGQGTQHGFSPGLYIGRWFENILNESDRRDCLPYRQPNIVGFYLFTDNQSNNAHSMYWVDDIYIQIGTRSRVVLGNAANYEECTKTEIQEPTAWSDGEIQFTLNEGGSFQPGEQAYIFVINENEYDQGDRDAFGNGHYDFAGVSPGHRIILE